jgi:hypothetical protein
MKAGTSRFPALRALLQSRNTQQEDAQTFSPRVLFEANRTTEFDSPAHALAQCGDVRYVMLPVPCIEG